MPTTEEARAERWRKWQIYREVFTIVAGTILIVLGVTRSEPAMMTVGGGLMGWSPAAKGPG